MKQPLKFKVAPHIMEDLGLNLYTSLPRVLVEFVANAHDADSQFAKIQFDKVAIDQARKVLKANYEADLARRDMEGQVAAPLATRVLPENVAITIEDAGIGMSREDLDTKFLVAGRRRRVEEPQSNCRTPGGRILMGRKGLGKLAGFGVAKKVEVTTKTAGAANAIRITLDYDELIKKARTDEIEIPEEELHDDAHLGRSGTRVVLSSLLYDPTKSRTATIQGELAEHFLLVKAEDFTISVNGSPISQGTHAVFSFAWPKPELGHQELVAHELPREDGTGMVRFLYRMRFTPKGRALPAAQRGVRIYAHGRLAASPSLLDANTNMHGFRMSDYLDGVVQADFIDDEETDYIATDRQSLRWDSPLLRPVFEFLSSEIREACKQAQLKRDEEAPNEVKKDSFTIAEIRKHEFSTRERRIALQIAAALERSCKQGVSDPVYKASLPTLFDAIGHATIVSAIAELAAQENPELHRVAAEIARLTRDEVDQFATRARIRLRGIEALKKIVQATNFKLGDNEAEIQKLLEDSPWLIDPTYSQFLTANKSLDSVVVRLGQELKVGKHFAVVPDSNDRPDLVFLLASHALRRIVIVELKSANKPLDITHLNQLQDYMSRAEDWLEQTNQRGFTVHGQLIGTLAPPTSQGRDIRVLRSTLKKAGDGEPWRVRDYLTVLQDTEAAHNELIEINRSLSDGDSD